MEKDPTQPNFYNVSQERKSLRETLSESKDAGAPETIAKKIEAELESANEQAKDFTIEKAGGLSEAKELL